MNYEAVLRSLPFNIIYYISFHSPNYLPDIEAQATFRQINMTEQNVMKYSEHRIHRLGKGYDTDCYDYESDNNFGYYRMRSDCINDCYQKSIKQTCKVDHGLFMSHSLIRKEYLIDGNERMLSCYDPAYNRENFSLKIDCEKICKVKCNFKYYPVEFIERLYS